MAVDPVPSLSAPVSVTVASAAPSGAVVGVPVGVDGDVPALIGVDRDALTRAGFTGKTGQTLVRPGSPTIIAYGTGDSATPGDVRDAVAAFALATADATDLAVKLPPGVEAGAAAQAAVEGALLARYRYEALKREPTFTRVASLTVVSDDPAATAGAARGAAGARATNLARDLANSPAGLLTATRFAEIATAIGADVGLTVEVFDKAALTEMGCGGLLAVNLGSAEPPTMIKIGYTPKGTPSGHLSLVGKGIMYDSGGISLKPADEVHATMKNDMSGAAAILAALSVAAEVGVPAAVTAYLMCTDNMPSGTAMRLGDVFTARGGRTVEVLNTDAEGRLVMCDALALAVETSTDAIVDVATLTGAVLRTFGPEVAGVMGNDQALIDQILYAAGATGEPVWQLPLDRRYRKWLDSNVADIANIGGATAGSITAALFLAEFVDKRPWAHLDIAGTAQNATAAGWRPAGCTGFGARLLIDLLTRFDPGPLGGDGRTVANYALTGVTPA